MQSPDAHHIHIPNSLMVDSGMSFDDWMIKVTGKPAPNLDSPLNRSARRQMILRARKIQKYMTTEKKA